MKRDVIFWYVILLIFALAISFPLFSTTYITAGHDIGFHLMRIEGTLESFKGGQFPVRITGYDFNSYGETSGIFYPNLFIYIPMFFRLCGFSIATAYNLFCILINIATVFCVYWSFSRLFNSKQQGAVGAMIYTGFLYRIIDIYSRSAVGEAIAMAFIPLALISLWLTLHRNNHYWSAVVIGFTGILQSHVISTLIAMVIAVMIMIYSYRQVFQNKLAIIKIALFTTLINLWFYVPFVTLYHQIRFHMQNVALNENHHVLSRLVVELGGIVSMQAFCGFVPLFILLAFIILWYRHRERFHVNRIFWFMLSTGIICSLAEFSRIICHILEAVPLIGKNLGILQFPYRFMILGTLVLSYCLAIALTQIFQQFKFSSKMLIVFCFLIAETNVFYLIYAPNISMVKFDRWNIKFDIPENPIKKNHLGCYDYIYYDVHKKDLIDEQRKSTIPFDDIQPAEMVSNFQKVGTTINFTASTKEAAVFTMPLFYYPGYEAITSDGTSLNARDKGGGICIDL